MTDKNKNQPKGESSETGAQSEQQPQSQPSQSQPSTANQGQTQKKKKGDDVSQGMSNQVYHIRLPAFFIPMILYPFLFLNRPHFLILVF